MEEGKGLFFQASDCFIMITERQGVGHRRGYAPLIVRTTVPFLDEKADVGSVGFPDEIVLLSQSALR